MSIEGVQLCALNAERLLRDSFGVSEPTAVALCEFAIEEAAKGLMMELVIELENTDETDEDASGGTWLNPALTPGEQQKIEEFFERKRPYLEGLKKDLRDAFSRHPPKLDFLSFALEYDAVTVPILSPPERLQTINSNLLGPLFIQPKPVAPPGIAEIQDFLESVKIDRIQHLQTIKNEALYVGLFADGSVASPSLAGPLLPFVRQLAILTLAGLKLGVALRARQRPVK